MTWQKHGLIFTADNGPAWMRTHAALPVLDPQDDGHFRVYLASRDEHNRAHIGAFKSDLTPGSVPYDVTPEPLLSPGPIGTFDDSGVTTSCILTHSTRKLLFYTGWSLGVTVPFYLFIGLAISEDGGRTFRKHSAAPLLDRTAEDPFLTASPFVMLDEGIWRMWYVSATHWELENSRPKHYYFIKYAESDDGLHWRRSPDPCIRPISHDEHAFARPWVVKDGPVYRMWYAYRGVRYRIGYAESTDGIDWKRRDDAVGIGTSAAGWDSDMIEYPCVSADNGNWLMLYNGNDYGGTGIGLATRHRLD